jgi:uncharacterized lipoprotein YddW (UPF0748 family)
MSCCNARRGRLALDANPEKPVILHVDYGDQLHLARDQGDWYGRRRIDSLMDRSAAAGVTTIFWRVSMIGAANYPSKIRYQINDPLAHQTRVNEPATHTFTVIGPVYERALQDGDPLQLAIDAAHRNGMQLYAYVTLFDESYPGAESKFVQQRPECCWQHRYYTDKRLPGLLSYACPEVIEYRLSELAELLAYDLDGIYYDTARTHTGVYDINALPFSDFSPYCHYGFNDIEVGEYEARYGICPRLQNLKDAVLPEQRAVILDGRWDRLRGEYLTAYLAEAAARIKAEGRRLTVGLYTDADTYLSPAGQRGRAPMGRFHHDWQAWAAGGLIDDLVLVAGDHRRFGADDWRRHSAAQFKAARSAGLRVHIWASTEGRIDQTPAEIDIPLPLSIETEHDRFLETMEEALRISYELDADGLFLHEAWDVERYDYFSTLARALS